MRSDRRQRTPEPPSDETLRLQSFLARAGVASRRASEELILAGRVTVNGKAPELGSKVDPYLDTVRVDGRPVSLRAREWVMLHKPRGYVTTREDPTGRKTVYDLLPPELHHLFHVGRLDRDSSGLLLLTNDGDTANRLLHPRYGTTKVYRVDVEERPSRETLNAMVDGVRLEDGIAQAVSVEVKGEVDDGIYRLTLVMQEGRNREVRRLLEAVGHPVRRLFRRQFGPLDIGRLPPGEWRRLTRAEVQELGGETGGGAQRSGGEDQGRRGNGGDSTRRQSGGGVRGSGPAGRPAPKRPRKR